MKRLTLLVLMIVTIAGCASSMLKQSEDITIEYQAITRGARRDVTIKQDSIRTLDIRGAKTSVIATISREEWKSVVQELDKINLKEIADLKAPSEKRFYDGALIATLSVKLKDTTYRSSSFDHGNPPAEIAVLVNKIVAMSALDKEDNED